MLEAGAPEQTVMSIAGHVSRQMLEHYSHQRIDAKAKVLDLINPDKRKKEAQTRSSFARGASRAVHK